MGGSKSLLIKLSHFEYAYAVTSQTYSRKINGDVLAPLASLGATAHKVAPDICLLANLKEVIAQHHRFHRLSPECLACSKRNCSL